MVHTLSEETLQKLNSYLEDILSLCDPDHSPGREVRFEVYDLTEKAYRLLNPNGNTYTISIKRNSKKKKPEA